MLSTQSEDTQKSEWEQKIRAKVAAEGYSKSERNSVIREIIKKRKENFEKKHKEPYRSTSSVDDYEFSVLTMKGLLSELSRESK